jgi:hypothetical protein
MLGNHCATQPARSASGTWAAYVRCAKPSSSSRTMISDDAGCAGPLSRRRRHRLELRVGSDRRPLRHRDRELRVAVEVSTHRSRDDDHVRRHRGSRVRRLGKDLAARSRLDVLEPSPARLHRPSPDRSDRRNDRRDLRDLRRALGDPRARPRARIALDRAACLLRAHGREERLLRGEPISRRPDSLAHAANEHDSGSDRVERGLRSITGLSTPFRCS